MGNWEHNIGGIQLKGDFPVEFATICMQTESVQKPCKLKDAFSIVSVTIKKPLSETEDINRINISQENCFL